MKNAQLQNGDLVRIREVYAIAQRLENKIDALDARLSNMEGRAWGISLVVSVIMTAAINFFIRKEV